MADPEIRPSPGRQTSIVMVDNDNQRELSALIRAVTDAPTSALLGLPEDLVDLGDQVEQLLALGRVHGALGAGRAGGLGRLVEQLVQVRVLLEVRGLEVVGPENPQVVLDELGALFLDQDRTRTELRVLVALVLL